MGYDQNKYEAFRSDVDFIEQYKTAINAASGSEVDANSNVSTKNVATMVSELHKKKNIMINRLMVHDKLIEMEEPELADEYIRQLEKHEIYTQDESSLFPYCCAISCYSFLLHGLTHLGGTSTAPKNLDSFCGGFLNLLFLVAAQFAGAVATPEFLPYITYFIMKEYGPDFYKHTDDVVSTGVKPKTMLDVIHAKYACVTYTANQPAAARGNQSVFWNIGYFDEPYFRSLFETFYFPDGTKMTDIWPAVQWVQKDFMNWLNNERTKAILTFPVETLSLLTDGTDFVDRDTADWAAEMWAKGHSFFVYCSDTPDSLSSCCRLRNAVDASENTFSYTLGAGGLMTGSKRVITMNLNRLVQNATRGVEPTDEARFAAISKAVRTQVTKIHKYLHAFNEIYKEEERAHLLTVYDAGMIALDKQYLTVGINGLADAAEAIGIEISDNPRYKAFVQCVLEPIYEEDRKDRTTELRFNCEQVPAENLGVKNAKWDKRDGYIVNRDCYNSYFYLPEDPTCTPQGKLRLHGGEYTRYLDGGSACHINLNEHLSKGQYKFLMKQAIKNKTPYWTFNIPNTICNNCGHISKKFLAHCPKCGSENLDYATRIIGYLTRISKWSIERQAEAAKRYYSDADTVGEV